MRVWDADYNAWIVYVKAIILKKKKRKNIAIEIRKGRYREKEKQYNEYGSPQIFFPPCMKDIIPDTGELWIIFFFKLPGAWKTKVCPIIKLSYILSDVSAIPCSIEQTMQNHSNGLCNEWK